MAASKLKNCIANRFPRALLTEYRMIYGEKRIDSWLKISGKFVKENLGRASLAAKTLVTNMHGIKPTFDIQELILLK